MGTYDAKQAIRSRTVTDAHADVTFNTSTAENTLATLTLPTDLAAGDIIIPEFYGNLLNVSGIAATFDFKVKLGSTVMWDCGAQSFSSNGQARGWALLPRILIVTTADERAMWWTATVGSGTLGAAQGVGTHIAAKGTNATEDVTVAKDIVLTVTMGASASNVQTVLNHASLTILRRS